MFNQKLILLIVFIINTIVKADSESYVATEIHKFAFSNVGTSSVRSYSDALFYGLDDATMNNNCELY